MKFLEPIYLTDDKGDRTMVFTAPKLKNEKGVLVKGEEAFRIKLANKGDLCDFIENRNNQKVRVAFRALSGTFIQGDVEEAKVKPLILAVAK